MKEHLEPEVAWEKQRQEFVEKLEILSQLSEHDGWKLFVSKAKLMAQTAEQSMMSEKDPVKVMEARAALLTLRNMIAWPEQESNVLKSFLRAGQE